MPPIPKLCSHCCCGQFRYYVGTGCKSTARLIRVRDTALKSRRESSLINWTIERSSNCILYGTLPKVVPLMQTIFKFMEDRKSLIVWAGILCMGGLVTRHRGFQDTAQTFNTYTIIKGMRENLRIELQRCIWVGRLRNSFPSNLGVIYVPAHTRIDQIRGWPRLFANGLGHPRIALKTYTNKQIMY